MTERLTGKVVIVAGAGGIGDELARRYAREGAAVVVGDLDGEAAGFVAAHIVEEGGTATGIALDGADDDAIAAAVRLALAEYGGLHGFHANFASFRDGAEANDILDMSMDAYDEVMRVNARGFVLCTRHAVPAMIESGGGTMLYTSSGAAYIGEPLRAAYAMSKQALHALMRHVAVRFGPQGIRANVIAPGVISHARFEAVVPAEEIARFQQLNLFGNRLGRPEDIAAMGALLLSDEGAFVTGQVISVDGGNTMRP